MAITIVEDYTKRTSDENEKGQRSYVRVFNVTTDNHKVGAGVVRESVGIPRFSTYETETEYDTFSFCKTKQAACVSADGKSWTVTVNYGPPDNGQESPTENPLEAPLQVSWSFAQFDKTVYVTRDGEPIQNTAGVPYASGLNRDDSRPVLAIVRNEASFNAALAYSYRDTVNSDSFMGAGPGQVKVSNISGARQYDPNYGFFWTVSYEFQFSAEGFEKKVASMGLHEKNDQGKLVPIMNGSSEATDPVHLDDKGKAKPGGPAKVQTFKLYNETSFSGFGF